MFIIAGHGKYSFGKECFRMETIAFFDTRSYDKIWFSRLAEKYGVEMRWLDVRLDRDTAILAHGCAGVCAFVNDIIDADVIKTFQALGIGVVALRCAGFNNVDLNAAEDKVKIFRVPAYSPSSIAEHTAALMLTLVRKTARAVGRTRDHNFSLDGLIGGDLRGRTAGIVGTGKVGQLFCNICLGFGMKILAHDPEPVWGRGIEYVRFDELCRRSDVISLHCPLTPKTYHIINRATFNIMKPGVIILNTSRGALIDSEALADMIKAGKVGGAGLDVYEEESDVFYEDVSDKVLRDDVLTTLIAQPNVVVTSHQAFLTDDALHAIAETTLQNLRNYFDGRPSENEIFAKHEEIKKETAH